MHIDYRRTLPHIIPRGGTFFVTSCLHGSLPKTVLDRLKTLREQSLAHVQTMHEDNVIDRTTRQLQEMDIRKKYFGHLDAYLDKASQDVKWLAEPQVRSLVMDSFQHRDPKIWTVHAYTIMPNHTHALITPRSNRPLYSLLQDFKKWTGRKANTYLDRVGERFWQKENYDHLVRDSQEFMRILIYILRNPVRAGLVRHWSDWPGSFVTERYAGIDLA